MGAIWFLITAAYCLVMVVVGSRMLTRPRRRVGLDVPARLGALSGTASDTEDIITTNLSTLVALSTLSQAEACPPVEGAPSPCAAGPSPRETEATTAAPATNDAGGSSSYEGGGSSYDSSESASYDGGGSSSYDSGGTSY